MSAALSTGWRAWRFEHPAMEGAEAGGDGGLRVGPTGAIEMVAGDMAVRQSILLLLSTAPGERVMRPGYGCDLNRLVFSPNDATTAGLAIHYVGRALRRWEPRIEILRLDAGANLEPEGSGDLSADPQTVLQIILEYRVRATQRRDRLVYAVNLAGEGGP